eukprot:2725611-Pyramimonas_sp.AAC.1
MSAPCIRAKFIHLSRARGASSCLLRRPCPEALPSAVDRAAAHLRLPLGASGEGGSRRRARTPSTVRWYELP